MSAAYTIFGGLKAVVWTDMIQSVLLLGAGIVIALLTFDKLGGWDKMMALDAAAGDAAKMHLYLPSNHPKLPFPRCLPNLAIDRLIPSPGVLPCTYNIPKARIVNSSYCF